MNRTPIHMAYSKFAEAKPLATPQWAITPAQYRVLCYGAICQKQQRRMVATDAAQVTCKGCLKHLARTAERADRAKAIAAAPILLGHTIDLTPNTDAFAAEMFNRLGMGAVR